MTDNEFFCIGYLWPIYSLTSSYGLDTHVCPYQAIYMACQIPSHQCVTITTKDRYNIIWTFFGHPWYRLFLWWLLHVWDFFVDENMHPKTTWRYDTTVTVYADDYPGVTLRTTVVPPGTFSFADPACRERSLGRNWIWASVCPTTTEARQCMCALWEKTLCKPEVWARAEREKWTRTQGLVWGLQCLEAWFYL
jgi:hypothetical protein